MSHEGKKTLAVVGTAAALFGGYEALKALPDTPSEVAAKDAQQFPLDVTSGKAVNVLENGVATINLGKGKYVEITNPVITKSGHVIGRNKLTGDVVVYYMEDSTEGEGKNNAQHIDLALGGKAISEDQAKVDTHPLVLQTPQKVGNSGEFAYVAAAGQGFKEPIAVGTPEHTVTIEKIVPDTAT